MGSIWKGYHCIGLQGVLGGRLMRVAVRIFLAVGAWLDYKGNAELVRL